MKIRIIALYLVTVTSLTACGVVKEKDKIINNFEFDGNTVQYKNMINFTELDKEENMYDNADVNKSTDIIDKEPSGSELKINKDLNITYELKNKDIIYKGVVFKGLANALDLINGSDKVIQFMVENIYTNDKELICRINTDLESNNAGEIASVSDFETLNSIPKYKRLVKKYGKDVEWSISVDDSINNYSVYGCDKYMFLLNSDMDIIVGDESNEK